MFVEAKASHSFNRLYGLLATWLPAALLALPFLVLLPGMAMFPYRSSGSLYTDYAITHYPNAIFLLRMLRETGQIPFWSPTILSGYPFLANPLSGLLYPPGWLAYPFPLPFGFNLMVAAHLSWGGIGLYRLMIRDGMDRRAALLAGAGFALLPKLYAHLGAGHLTLLYAVPWTPWLLLASQNDGGPDRRRKRSALAKMAAPGLILGLIFLADVRWSLYAGLLWIAYLFIRQQRESLRRTGSYLAKQAALAFCIAAPLALPLLEYLRLSSRAGLSPHEVGTYSLTLAGLLGLFFPDFQGNHEWVVYAGGVPLALAVSGLFLRGNRRGMRFWMGVCLAALLLALGASMPGFGLLARVPGFNLLRVPARSLFLAGLSMCAIGGYVLDNIISLQTGQSRRPARLALAALAAVSLLLLLGLSLQGGGMLRFNLLWGSAFVAAGAVWTWHALGRSGSKNRWLAGIFLLAILDWVGVARLSFFYRPAAQVLAENQEVAAFLKEQPGDFRVYSPSYSLPQQTAAHAGLELADGVDPLHLEAYADYIEEASGVPRGGYQVTVPTFSSGDPAADNRAHQPDPAALGRLNAAYVVADFDLDADQLVLLRTIGDTRLYQNEAALPRAWLQPAGLPLGENWKAVQITGRGPNRLQLSAYGPGLMVLSEIAYPGWQVRVDGRPGRLQVQENLLRSVTLTEGWHRVEFYFRPGTFYAGLAILAVGLCSWAILANPGKRRG